MLKGSITFFILMLVSSISNATIIISKEHLEQRASFEVLGNTYITSYSGAVSGFDRTTKQDISMVFEQDQLGNDLFSSISTDLNAAGALAYYYGSAQTQAWSQGYGFTLNSDRWAPNGYPDSPDAHDAYYHYVQDTFIDYSLVFRVVGSSGILQTSEYIEFPQFGTVDFLLLDHTAGTSHQGSFGSVALQDGHVYTAKARLANTAGGEHSVYGELYFSGDTLVLPTTSSVWLMTTGLLILLLMGSGSGGMVRRKLAR
jgi:hypothetical protein